jgi:hypothetical protein
VGPYLLEAAKEKKMIEGTVAEFKKNLKRAKKEHLRYWFILENPFSTCNDETFAKGHAFISRLSQQFRIR